jgi:adenine deaminase
VPASGFETSGSRLAAADLLPFLAHRRVLGLAERMNYPGVLNKDPAVLRKLAAFSPAPIDGHAPELTGRDLAAYIATGISSDHECTTADEAREKVRLGMTVCIREGSSAKDLEALLPAVTPANAGSFTFATDDFQAHDLQQGSIDLLVRKAVCLGLDPVMAVRMATLNAARHYGLRHKGAVAPGYDADMVVAADLGRFAVEQVFKLGKLVAGAGRCTAGVRSRHHEQLMGTVRTGRVDLEDLALKARTGSARVIELVPDQLETKCSVLPVAERGGFVVSDPERDILKLAVIERHRATGNRGMGLLKGLGLTAGALASTVAHDSHNIIAVGVTDGDMLAAVARVQEMHGGLAVVHRGKVLADLPLPVAGLLSTKPLGRVVRELSKIDAAVRSLGVPIEHPFGALSFLALPVIPELKLTDRGLVDVKQFAFVDLFV